MDVVGKITEAKKAVAAVVGVVTLAIANGFISGTAAKWTDIVIGALIAAGVYVVPNGSSAPVPPPAPAPVADPGK